MQYAFAVEMNSLWKFPPVVLPPYLSPRNAPLNDVRDISRVHFAGELRVSTRTEKGKVQNGGGGGIEEGSRGETYLKAAFEGSKNY